MTLDPLKLKSTPSLNETSTRLIAASLTLRSSTNSNSSLSMAGKPSRSISSSVAAGGLYMISLMRRFVASAPATVNCAAFSALHSPSTRERACTSRLSLIVIEPV